MSGFKSNATKWLANEYRKMDRVEEVMAGVILTRAIILSPKDSGDLAENGRVVKNPEGGRSIIFGDASVPYARIRHFENKKNPQTLGYLAKAGDSVAKESIKKYVSISR